MKLIRLARLILILPAILGSTCVAAAAEKKNRVQRMPAAQCSHTDQSFRCVQFVKNYDGDTITFNISNVHPLFGKDINIRVLGVDTPEMNVHHTYDRSDTTHGVPRRRHNNTSENERVERERAEDVCEERLARFAQRWVENKLRDANRIDLQNPERDKYFRILADVIVDGVSLKNALLATPLAYPYDGGTKPNRNWCPNLETVKSHPELYPPDDEGI